jgi:two-component system, cell cycle response regulator DivK
MLDIGSAVAPEGRMAKNYSSAARARPDAARKRQLVLVVEDDVHEQEIYGRILWYNGFNVLFADSAADGLRLAREHRPDLILLDLGLPDAHGLDLCTWLRNDATTATVPVIALTGMPRSQEGARAARAGCLRYIEKPTGPVDVLHEIERVIGRPPLPGEGEPRSNRRW